MPKKDDVNSLRTSKEFIAYAKRHGAEIVLGKGSHVKVRNKKGIAVIPNHTGDLATGTRRAIVKAFVAMGIGLLLILLALNMLSWA